MSRGRNWSFLFLLEQPLELTNQLSLLLDNKVSGPDIRKEWVVITVGIGPVMGLGLGRHWCIVSSGTFQ